MMEEKEPKELLMSTQTNTREPRGKEKKLREINKIKIR